MHLCKNWGMVSACAVELQKNIHCTKKSGKKPKDQRDPLKIGSRDDFMQYFTLHPVDMEAWVSFPVPMSEGRTEVGVAPVIPNLRRYDWSPRE